jgi:hypothetical protein
VQAPAVQTPEPAPAVTEPVNKATCKRKAHAASSNSDGASKKAAKRSRQPRADGVLNRSSAAVRRGAASASINNGSAPPDALTRSKQTQIVLTQPSGKALTLGELQSDVIVALAERTWGPGATKGNAFQPEVVRRLYTQELAKRGAVGARRVQVLELSQYLERYLWPHFEGETATDEHVMSIVFIINEKFREGVPPWDTFVAPAEALPHASAGDAPCDTPAACPTEKWQSFFKRTLDLAQGGLSLDSRPMNSHEATQYLRFIIHLFQSLESQHVQDSVLRLTSLPLWHALSLRRRELELFLVDQELELPKKWKRLEKRDAKAAAAAAKNVRVLDTMALFCGVFVRLHSVLFPAGRPFLPCTLSGSTAATSRTSGSRTCWPPLRPCSKAPDSGLAFIPVHANQLPSGWKPYPPPSL